MLRSQLRILLAFSSHLHFCHIQDIAKNSAMLHFCNPFDCFAISVPYGYLAKLRLDGSFPSVIFRCSCTCHYVSFAAMCHTHEHLQRHSGNDGVLRHPRLPKQNNFPPGKLLCFINLPTLILSQTMLLHCPQQNKTEVVFRLPPLRPPPSFIIVWV